MFTESPKLHHDVFCCVSCPYWLLAKRFDNEPLESIFFLILDRGLVQLFVRIPTCMTLTCER
jgi:hypothetical protein